jgi:hypothetical protein
MNTWLVIFSPLLSAIVAVLLVPYVQQRFIWGAQKRIEFRRAALDEALKALAMREADAYSPYVQSKPPADGGLRRVVEFRDETAEQMQRARYLVRAFFPPETASAFEKALNFQISIKTGADPEYREHVVSAIRLMSADLGLTDPTGPLFWTPRFWRP